MKKKNNGRSPFCIEVRISDEKGKKIFHWKPGRNNLIMGMEKTNEYIKHKLGIDTINTEEKEKIKELVSALKAEEEEKKE